MKKLLALAVLSLAVLSQSGCGCNRPFMSWFNRGDNCAPPADQCATGVMPRAAMMFPSGTTPPGAEILPYPGN